MAITPPNQRLVVGQQGPQVLDPELLQPISVFQRMAATKGAPLLEEKALVKAIRRHGLTVVFFQDDSGRRVPHITYTTLQALTAKATAKVFAVSSVRSQQSTDQWSGRTKQCKLRSLDCCDNILAIPRKLERFSIYEIANVIFALQDMAEGEFSPRATPPKKGKMPLDRFKQYQKTIPDTIKVLEKYLAEVCAKRQVQYPDLLGNRTFGFTVTEEDRGLAGRSPASASALRAEGIPLAGLPAQSAGSAPAGGVSPP